MGKPAPEVAAAVEEVGSAGAAAEVVQEAEGASVVAAGAAEASRGRGGGARGGRGGFKGGKQVILEPHRHPGVFIARGKEDALVTKNLVPGSEVYGEKRISVENEGEKVEYRVWNPFRSKLAAAIMGGVDAIHMPPGSRVLYLGAASGTTVSHNAGRYGGYNIC
ncbi:unnamed protein product [Leptidea sinapis]|uniref:rRNA 2'-O-methyltransferase fibrillarin n=1 Tax=Leptidea sinapis TaxID=189913 RepID=A0A5E4Q8A0_9NEOP|nr:unnamed protein product [Leptidea sinapis]